MPDRPPFHLAIAVDDLEAARAFYGGLLACPEGRSAEHWVDFDLYGHQLVCHWVSRDPGFGLSTEASGEFRGDRASQTNPVDGHAVPIPHFGVVLELPQWHELAERLRAAGVDFVIEPTLRFAGQPGEQAILFLSDPAGNALEFKAFADIDRQLFES